MLRRGFMGVYDIKPDRVAFATSSVAGATSIATYSQPRKTLLEKTLSVICDVRPGEVLGAIILTIDVFTPSVPTTAEDRQGVAFSRRGWSRGEGLILNGTGDRSSGCSSFVWLDRHSF
jgi:hypothetical protein